MQIGFKGESFANLLVLLTFIGILVIFLVSFIAHKRGIDITRNRFMFTLFLVVCVALIIIPLLLADIPQKIKFLITFLGLLAGVSNYFVIGKIQDNLRILIKKN